MYIQTRAFNQANATKVKNMCLMNVRTGYGIAPRHATAWQAWLNTPQFTNDIPNGVDVPVYFSYTTTINGVRDNYGHIGVRLANGKFWSDGTVYPNLASYRLTHPTVHYRGWSTHVNGIQVIKYQPPTHNFNMPPVGSRIQLLPVDTRTTFKAGTTTQAGTIRVNANDFIYVVRGYDSKYPNRIIINSASAGGNGVSLALYYLNGAIIPKWRRV